MLYGNALQISENQRSKTDVIKSVQTLKGKYDASSTGKSIKGFVQFFNISPFTVAMWGEGDVEMYHQMSVNNALVVNATGSIATKLSEKEIFFFLIRILGLVCNH